MSDDSLIGDLALACARLERERNEARVVATQNKEHYTLAYNRVEALTAQVTERDAELSRLRADLAKERARSEKMRGALERIHTRIRQDSFGGLNSTEAAVYSIAAVALSSTPETESDWTRASRCPALLRPEGIRCEKDIGHGGDHVANFREKPLAWCSSGPVFIEPAPDPMHPAGRCTCAGEGRCSWCQRSDEPAPSPLSRDLDGPGKETEHG
jgi:hypothetical protein